MHLETVIVVSGEDPKPPIERVIPKPVRVFYHITDTECEIRDNTTFANNFYKLFTGSRDGIKNCCGDVDFEKAVDKEGTIRLFLEE